MKILLKRGTTAEWAANDIVLDFGRPGVELTTDGKIKFKIGDGENNWSSLPYVSGDVSEVISLIGNLNNLDTTDKTNLVAAINSILASKGQANGIASLDGTGKVPTSQLPDHILGQMLYGGTWNANTAIATLTDDAKARIGATTNTITLTNNTAPITGYTANEGIYYITQTAGTFAGETFNVGDWLLSTGSGWESIKNSDAVVSVNGKTGTVILSAEDVGAEPAFTKNTAFNKNFGTTSDTVAQGNDSRIVNSVQTSGNQTIGGTKTFSTSPVVPNKTTKATNSGTSIATEAQVYEVEQELSEKQDALSSQQIVNINNVPNKLDKNLGAGLAGQFLIVGDNGDIITTDTIDDGGGGGDGGGGDSTRKLITTLTGPIDGTIAGGGSGNYIINSYTFYEDRIVGQVTIIGGGGIAADYIGAMLDFMNHPLNDVDSIFDIYSTNNGGDYNFDLTLTSSTDIDVGGYTGKYVLLKDCSGFTSNLPRNVFIGDTELNYVDPNSSITEDILCSFTLRFSPRV